ncbi:unnamed protein product [Ixodes pacificus]
MYKERKTRPERRQCKQIRIRSPLARKPLDNGEKQKESSHSSYSDTSPSANQPQTCQRPFTSETATQPTTSLTKLRRGTMPSPKFTKSKARFRNSTPLKNASLNAELTPLRNGLCYGTSLSFHSQTKKKKVFLLQYLLDHPLSLPSPLS